MIGKNFTFANSFKFLTKVSVKKIASSYSSRYIQILFKRELLSLLTSVEKRFSSTDFGERLNNLKCATHIQVNKNPNQITPGMKLKFSSFNTKSCLIF